MLEVGLESHVKLQKTGFVWNQRYKGTTTRDIFYELFTPIVKCDTEEADTLSPKYLCRSLNVKQLCRVCTCPTVDTDKFSLKHSYKTKGKIKKLVEAREVKKLKAMSQHPFKSAFYKVRFNLGNDRSIHGATPFEKLHHIDLGIFPRVRDVFFKMVGPTSALAHDINGLATVYGKLHSHQSDRTMPATNFSNGIQAGKLMAREYKGVMLILATVLMSTKGRELLSGKRRFKQNETKDDWLMLTELLLQWECFLNEGKMKRQLVLRLKKKHKYIMYVIKKVAQRVQKTGMKFVKYDHGILHMIGDI